MRSRSLVVIALLALVVTGSASAPSAQGPQVFFGNPSESEFLRYLNFGFHVAPTADQDNHRENWGNSTHARVGVVADAAIGELIVRVGGG